MLINGRTFATQNMTLKSLVAENNRLLLLMEHFNIDITISDKTITDVCLEKNINPEIFTSFCNLYNGYKIETELENSNNNINTIIDFLENSHRYYKDEIYPEIKYYIKKLSEINNTTDVKMLEQFFDIYFNEVVTHLKYENKRTFPYIRQLANKQPLEIKKPVRYKMRHSDIETKLNDLKSLLLNHIKLKDQHGEKRKLLFAIFELEFDLNIHSTIEEDILMPLVDKIEKNF